MTTPTDREPLAELRVVTMAAWLARDLATGTDMPVAHDLGLDVPADTTRTAWWAPHQHIARLAVTPGATLPLLSSPGPAWLPTLDHVWLRRRVEVLPLASVAESTLWGPRAVVFAKPAEVKVRGMEADVYATPSALERAGRTHGLADESMIVLSEVVSFTAEYRCFIAPDQSGRPTVVAASAYLVGGATWDFWETAAAAPDASEAAAFARKVVDSVAGPAGYVLDVGQLKDGSWAVVEANASWSSNPYHCDPAGVVASILVSQVPERFDARWAWQSDPYMTRFARPLPVRPS